MKLRWSKLSFILLLVLLNACRDKEPTHLEFTKNLVSASENMVAYQSMELIGFIHFTVNTFTDKEWGYGDESPKIFNPTALDTDQWAKTAKEAGLKQLILTAKHHDGFCLWPSEYTEHSVKNSPYKNGQGDIVKEFVESCRKYGLKAGLYLSPWDRNHPAYGSEEYLIYYKNQLKELLSNYGEINEIWFDGANGGDGFYGGANETRKIDRLSYYNWEEMFSLVKELQPKIKIFSDAGPDVRWIGNEHGHAGFTCWSTIDSDKLVIGQSEPEYLNTGDPKGDDWIVGQCDVSIRPGWFYHKSQDSLVKSPQQLMDIYYKSVGRNGLLLLNLPPDKRGLIHENDIASLNEFRAILDETFSKNLLLGASIKANSVWDESSKFEASNVLDGDSESFWVSAADSVSAKLEIRLPKPVELDRILIQEPIRYGQRVSKFVVDIWTEGKWQTIFKGTTIGYKRLLRFNTLKAEKLRLRILDATNTPAISNFEGFKGSPKETTNF